MRRAVFEMSRRRSSWSESDSEEEGSSPQPKSHCSVESDLSSKISNKDDEVRLLCFLRVRLRSVFETTLGFNQNASQND